jgi:hypothetical protein
MVRILIIGGILPRLGAVWIAASALRGLAGGPGVAGDGLRARVVGHNSLAVFVSWPIGLPFFVASRPPASVLADASEKAATRELTVVVNMSRRVRFPGRW